ncbi:GDSL family lipase [Sedimentitalea sp. CY04]|uniref:GDSL family lipase n=1 Tax=Parasedimentitalea denitrificans TaxID=2211118 RepID=A0ABX0WB46_9RHOB|nr:SGNH/GDSL hydrolase family protein [Sedimentitalea sp. CY04]NIZ61895.1 GDSL family lipase [Sedimentitalea sp. CY04]
MPLLLAQALWVRRRAQLLPEPPGPRSGTSGQGPRLRLLIIGDSSGAGVGAASQDQALSGQLVSRLADRYQVTWRLEARTGNTTPDMTRQLASMPPETFDCAVVALGVNDVTRATTKVQFVSHQTALFDLLKSRFRVRQILCTGVPPLQHFPLLPQPLAWTLGRHAARLDSGLVQLAHRNEGVSHLPLVLPRNPDMAAQDGFHPSPKAYAIWAENLARNILSQEL